MQTCPEYIAEVGEKAMREFGRLYFDTASSAHSMASSRSAPGLIEQRPAGNAQCPALFNSTSIAPTNLGSSGFTSGAKRPTTFPARLTRNFSKFHSTSVSFLG